MRAYAWELEKLTAQARVRGVAAACLAGPPIGVTVLEIQPALPTDTLFGRWVHVSGLADSLVLLSFVTAYALPLLSCVVAGDIFAAEDRHGTWKTILTRGPGRMSIFWAKTLAAATVTVVIVLLLAVSSTAAGLLIVGNQPLVTLSGTLTGGGAAAWRVLASWATALPPALGFTALGLLLSVATRSSVAGIVGPAAVGLPMQLYSFGGSAEGLRAAMLSTAFESWHGLLSDRVRLGPVVSAGLVSAAYAAACVAAAAWLLRRREFAHG